MRLRTEFSCQCWSGSAPRAVAGAAGSESKASGVPSGFPDFRPPRGTGTPRLHSLSMACKSPGGQPVGLVFAPLGIIFATCAGLSAICPPPCRARTGRGQCNRHPPAISPHPGPLHGPRPAFAGKREAATPRCSVKPQACASPTMSGNNRRCRRQSGRL